MQTLLKHWADALLEWLGLASAQDSGWDRWVAFTLVLLAVALFDFVCRTILVRGMRRIVKRTKATWDDDLFNPDVLSRLCNVVSAVVLGIVLPVVFEEQSEARTIVTRLVEVYIVVAVFRFINAVLFAVFQIASARPAWQNKPIKGLRQTGQGIAALICAILIVSILIGRDPTDLLLGLGASAALVSLVFKDTILGFVASIQLSAQDMIRPGDWIEMPSKGADGVVSEINVNSVKVRNWDNTMTMIPIYSLVSESFTNWRNMEESAGRRFKRPLRIDATTVSTLSEEQLTALTADPRIAELAEAMLILDRQTGTSPCRTNFGLFRCYAQIYMARHPKVVHSLPVLARYLPWDENGLTLEIYGFSTEKSFPVYEQVVADLLNHLLAVMPAFGLRLYQRPAAPSASEFGSLSPTTNVSARAGSGTPLA